MERFVRIVAPTSAATFVLELGIVLFICGLLNHIRDIIMNGSDHGTYWHNLGDAAFTALPMCTIALLLIAHLNKLQSSLHRQATRDDLTGLRNRRWFMGHCPAEFGPKDVLLFCDIDHFKRINDTYGHHIGDECLQTFAQHLIDALPDDVSPARIGGEEFGILLHDITDSQIKQIGDRIASGVMLDVPDGQAKRVTASVGITQPTGTMSLKEAFGFADQALYMAKEAGRADFRIFPFAPSASSSLTQQTPPPQGALTA